jgi:hypothetical protein
MKKNKTENSIDFKINDRVKIKDLGIKGTINALFITINEITFRVRFLYNFEPKELYFTNDEIELISEETFIGFKPDDKK